MKQSREFVACVLWTAAFVIMIFGTIDSMKSGHNSPALAWGLLLALAAHQLTIWAVILRHHADQEISVERVVEIVTALESGRRTFR